MTFVHLEQPTQMRQGRYTQVEEDAFLGAHTQFGQPNRSLSQSAKSLSRLWESKNS